MIITLDAFVNPHDRISVTPTHENVGAHFTCHAIALAKADVRPQRTGINPPRRVNPIGNPSLAPGFLNPGLKRPYRFVSFLICWARAFPILPWKFQPDEVFWSRTPFRCLSDVGSEWSELDFL